MVNPFLEAIARYEGFGADPKNRPSRNHNPGNLEWGEFARNHGAERIEIILAGRTGRPRYAYFPDNETGWQAMRDLYLGHYRGLTVAQAIAKHAPPTENDTAAYVKFVCQHAGCTPETLVDNLL